MRTPIRVILAILTVIGIAHYMDARRALPDGVAVGGCAAERVVTVN